MAASLSARAAASAAWIACVALRAAVPLLAKASKVYLATVAEEKSKERYDLPPVEGAEYLSRHGIAAEIVELPAGDSSVVDALLSAAQARERPIGGGFFASKVPTRMFNGYGTEVADLYKGMDLERYY